MNTIEDNKPKQLQLRRTAVDTAKAQATLYYLILSHIKSKAPLSHAECQTFIALVDDAVLSYGNVQGALKPKRGYPLFPVNITNLAYSLMECHTQQVVFTDGFRQIRMELVDVWRTFFVMCKTAFTYARAEALHMSSEIDANYQHPTAYQFSQDTFNTGVDK